MTDAAIIECAEDLAANLRRGGTVIALTGAGISRESGVPTYRGLDGLYTRVPEEIVTPRTLTREPALFWDFHDRLRQVLARARPNAAHLALAAMETAFAAARGSSTAAPLGFAVITQNIDGLHQAAGSRHVVELHGSAARNYCMSCGKSYDDLPSPLEANPPHCQCGSLIRPDVVLFEEALPQEALSEADRLAREAKVCLVVGTSANVYPAAQIPVIAWQSGAVVVEVNPDATPLTQIASHELRGPAGDALPALWRALEPLLSLS